MKSTLSIIRMEVSILFPDRVSEKSLEKSCSLCIRRIRVIENVVEERIRVQRHVHSFEAGRARRSVYRGLQNRSFAEENDKRHQRQRRAPLWVLSIFRSTKEAQGVVYERICR